MYNQNTNRFWGASLMAGSLVALTDAAVSQVIEEIVVTAQYREQSLQDIPIAISAISGEVLEDRGQESVADVGRYAPNVALSQSPSLNGSAIAAFIRGVGQSDSSFAVEPGVGIYIDDVYYGVTYGAVMDLTDLDRVEILRGPQGTLAGKNSIGGSVKLFTRKPDGNGGGFVEVTGGDFDRLDVRASGEFAINDALFMRLSGVTKERDGHMQLLDYGCRFPDSAIAAVNPNSRSCRLGTEGGQDVQSGRIALRFAPDNHALEINASVDAARDRSETVATKLFYADYPLVRSYDASSPLAGIPFDSRFITPEESYTSYATYDSSGNYTNVFGIPGSVAPGGFSTKPISEVDSYGTAVTLDYRLTDEVSLKSITAFRKAEGRSAIDVDGSPLAILLEVFEYEHEQLTQELRLSTRFGDAVNATFGAYYYDADQRFGGRNFIPTTQMDFLLNSPITSKSQSLFAHGEFHLSATTNIIAGVRYTEDEKHYQYGRRNSDGTEISGIPFTENWLVAGLDGLVNSFEDERVDYRVGLDHRWNDQLMTYFQVTTGFKGGGVNPRPSAPDQVYNFGPEEVVSVEAGLKADVLQESLRINGAVFFNDYTDMQLVRYQCPESVVLSCATPDNAGDAEILGAELELEWLPTERLRLDANLGYLDFDYTEITNPATLVTEDMTAPFISEWQLAAGIEYRLPIGPGEVASRLDWSYQSEFYYNAINNPYNKIDAIELLNARVTFALNDDTWLVSAAVTNLLDEFYYTGVAENVNTFGNASGVVGRPREWSLTLRRNF